MQLKIAPVTENFAAEASGLDLRQPIDAETAAEIEEAEKQKLRGPVVFDDQCFRPSELDFEDDDQGEADHIHLCSF